ncbi:hypothetical protein GF336_02875 [Candidatus Woesearchaeota archaeon]|nr:hypothetical protein [Candidatus Woesearchaeota archaeon]
MTFVSPSAYFKNSKKRMKHIQRYQNIILSTLFLLSMVLPLVCASDIYQTKEAELSISISSDILLEKTSDTPIIESLQADLLFFPEDSYRQEILSLEADPSAEIFPDKIRYSWEEPDITKLSFQLDSEIKTKNTFPEIKKKVTFPIINIPEEYEDYLYPTENIDINQDINLLASQLAEGEDDLYILTHKISSWVAENIEYDLSCGERVEKSSWVLENKRGTCDEFSSLFISLCRSLGIPSRYTAGIAYSNKPETFGFGSHAWAEVYFPGYGWVPFDPTYRQMGFIDPSHIKLADFKDSAESSTRYEWKTKDIEVSTNPLDIHAFLEDTETPIAFPFEIRIEPINKDIGFGSYNLIKAEITNPKDYYQATELALSSSGEVEIVGKKNRLVPLEPSDTKEVYWKIKLDSSLDDNYIYTFPVVVQTARNYTSRSEFHSSEDDTVYTEEDIDEKLSTIEEEKVKKYSSEVELECSPSVLELYMKEKIVVSCSLRNKGNTVLNDLDVCFMDMCKKQELFIAEEKSIFFEKTAEHQGKTEKLVTVKNNQISKSFPIELTILDKPDISITNISYPKDVEYDRSFIVSFLVEKISSSDPQEVDIQLKRDSYTESWQIDELGSDHEIKLRLKGNALKNGINLIEISITYKDKRKNTFSKKESFNIELTNITFTQQLRIWLNSIGNWFEGLF